MEAAHRSSLEAMHREYACTRDRELRNRLVECYEGFASALAYRYGRRQEDAEDLRQTALVGLVHAVERFNPDHGAEFLTFAYATIVGTLRRHSRDQGSAVRITRSLRGRSSAVSVALDELTQQLGRSPTLPELARALDLSVEEVVAAMEARGAQQMVSLDERAADGVVDGGGPDPGLDRVEERQLLGPLVARLPEREQLILRLRFVEEKSQSEIAGIVGVSQMHVSRLLARSLQRLRQWVDED